MNAPTSPTTLEETPQDAAPPEAVNDVIADAERPTWHPLHAFGFHFYAVRRNAAHQIVAWISQENADDSYCLVYACDGLSINKVLSKGTIVDAMKLGDQMIAALEAQFQPKAEGLPPTFEDQAVNVINDAIERDGF